MIKNKEEILKEIKKRLDKVAEDIVNKMETGSNKEMFSIDEIEEIGERAQEEAKKIILEEMNKAVNNIEEKEIIESKKKNTSKKKI